MNWIKENKFLSGFFAVMLIGGLALGYLLWTASSRYRDANASYEEQATELNRLKSLAPYPAAPNVEKIEAQRKEHQAAVLALQKSLAATEIPIEQITEVQFQDRLRETVSRVTAKANDRHMALPEKFYMGFAQYETQPPRAEAAPLLGRELKAIEVIVNQLIENNVAKLTKLERPELAEEKEPRAASGTRSESGSKSSSREEDHENDLVKKEYFDIGFVADQLAFNNALNSIVSNKTQFYVPRAIEIKNEKTKSPSKTEAPGTTAEAAPPAADATATPAAPAAPAAAAVPAPPPLPGAAAAGTSSQEAFTLVFGAEKLEVGMRIELIDFTPPPEAQPAR
jgi:hypothetical protein